MTAVMMEGGATGPAPQKKRRAIAGRNDGTVVAVAQLRPWLEQILAAFERQGENTQGMYERKGVADFCSAAQRFFPDAKPESLPRRLWSYLREEFNAANADVAERWLLAGEVSLHETDIIQLPGGLPAARERIDVYCEMHGRPLPLDVREEMAKDLFEFSLLMVYGDAGEVEEVEAA